MYNPEVNDFVTNYLSNEFFGRSPYKGSSKMDIEDKEKLQKIRENAINAFKEAPNNYRTQRQLFMDYFPQKAFTGQYETDYELYLSKLPIENDNCSGVPFACLSALSGCVTAEFAAVHSAKLTAVCCKFYDAAAAAGADVFALCVSVMCRVVAETHILTAFQLKLVKDGLLRTEYKRLCDLVSFPLSSLDADVSTQDALAYYYYSGMVFIGNKDYLRAQCCLAVAIDWPKRSLSQISLEAYKKYCLLAPMVGRLRTVCVSGALAQRAEPYRVFMRTGRISDELRRILVADHNLNLALQMEKEAMIVTLTRVAKMFVSIPLDELCKDYLRIPESQSREVVELAQRSKVPAHVEAKDGVSYLVFDDVDEPSDAETFLRENAKVMRAIQLCCAKINKTLM